MTRKRFVKLLMGTGCKRDTAVGLAWMLHVSMRMSYDDLWAMLDHGAVRLEYFNRGKIKGYSIIGVERQL